jgi:NADPH:quinone reductase
MHPGLTFIRSFSNFGGKMIPIIPKEMQAVLIEEKGAPLTVGSCPVPKPEAGEVLVRMAASPINPSDLATVAGISTHRKTFPLIPGLEGSGTVVAAGAGFIPRWLLGKRVACAAASPSAGSWAEYMVTSASQCVPLQINVTLEQGAMMLVNPNTALAFMEIAKHYHHKALVSTAAAGALGRMIFRLAKQNGIPIINIVRRKENVDLIQGLGAEHVLDSSQPDFSSLLETLVVQLKATLFLDAVAGKLTNQLLQAAPRGSTVILYSRASFDDCIIDPMQLLFENKRIEGFYLTDWLAKKNLVQKLLTSQKIQRLLGTQLSTTVQCRLPLSSVIEALQIYTSNMSAGKVLLTPTNAS